MQKQVYDLCQKDLENAPKWYFPMDDSVEDELSVRPVEADRSDQEDLRTISRATFVDSNGVEFIGYFYEVAENEVEYTQPVAWIGSVCVNFWNGMNIPSKEYTKSLRSLQIKWPVRFQKDGQWLSLDGIYYLDDANNVAVIK